MSTTEKILAFFWNNIVAKMDAVRMKAQIPTAGVCQHNDIPYLEDGNEMHLLDVYVPENAKGVLPVIIDVHGGGWMYGTKNNNKNYCLALANRGFVVFNLNYPLVPQVRFGQQLQSIFFAYRWIAEHCMQYGGDAQNIFLTGDSAGGNIVTLTAVLNRSKKGRSELSLCDTGILFRAIGATSPVINLTSGSMKPMASILLGKGEQNVSLARYLDFNAVYHGQEIPPFYIVTSHADFVHKQSIELAKLLKRYHAPYQLHDWNKQKGVALPHVFSVLQPLQAESVCTIDEMTTYFKQFVRQYAKS